MKNPKVKIQSQGLAENCATKGINSWSASTLITYCKEKNYPIFKLPVAGINLSEQTMPWTIYNISSFVYHMKRVNKVNMKYPIILDSEGGIVDGWHRVARAIIDGKTEIDAIRIEEMPLADGYVEPYEK